jgi:hypothetical protein
MQKIRQTFAVHACQTSTGVASTTLERK